MNTITHRFGALLIGALCSLAAWPAAADDTELFVATSDPALTGAKPNILFIYDNSGSMASKVLTQEAWNSNTTFEGCYDANRLYFSTNSTPPGCGSSNYINSSANRCNASVGPLSNVGSFTDRMLQWRSSFFTKQWVALSANHDRYLECQDDRGVHGQSAGSADKYAANGNAGPWDPTSANEPAWNTDYTIWNGNWLNWSTSEGTVTKTRMEVVREVTNNLLQDLNGVNVGLMHFNEHEGGTVAYAVENIGTSRSAMQDAVNALYPDNWTPLSETLYEAAGYYMGRAVDYGNVGPVQSVAASRVGNTSSGSQYNAPVNYACQKNYIVLLTDGLPTQDVGATTKIKALPDWATNVTDTTCSGTAGSNGECMSDLAEYLYRHDLDSSEDMPGLQNVTTYTIGFGVDLALGDTTFLQQTATKGGGRYFPAGDTATLTAALTAIVTEILDDATTFSTPTAPVNAFNRTENLSDVFVSVFAPATNEHWPGNLKKYRLEGGELVDASGVPAVDPSTGFFSDTSQSFWSDAVDGNNVHSGGAANELPAYGERNLYTNIGGNDLNASGNSVVDGNSAVTAAMIGAPDATTRTQVLNWARGLDSNDEDDDGDTADVRHVMGDPLHVRPVMVIYGGSEAAPDATVFVSTNDGYLHAIDPDDGHELWAFIPQELLPRLYDLYLDDTAPTRSYGLDGEITVYIENNDNVAGISGSEKVWLYFGMRRGGSTVFALDVTNRDDPQFVWKVSSETTGFENLGQTWSTPAIANVNVNGSALPVAIFGGGYDDGQDDAGYETDDRGNSIYMVNAATGALLWTAGNGIGYNLNLSQMTHSIPAAVRVLDLNQDHLADRMYVGDMGGRVWRFDIVNGQPGSSLVQGGVFAQLGGAPGPDPADADIRRFYATPDVARIVNSHGGYLSVSLGSGHREHPLDTATADEFYSLRDYHVFDVLANDAYTQPIVRDERLVDVTDSLTTVVPYDATGWRLRMELSPGEKVLSESRTFANSVYFSSFTPGGNNDACVAAGGLNRLYVVSVTDGDPVTNLDGSEDPEELTVEDRHRDLNQGGIAPDPAFFFTDPDDQVDDDDDDDDDDCTGFIGVESIGPCAGSQPVRTRWNQDGSE